MKEGVMDERTTDVPSLQYILGSFSIYDGNCSENFSFKMNSRFSIFVAFIPIC